MVSTQPTRETGPTRFLVDSLRPVQGYLRYRWTRRRLGRLLRDPRVETTLRTARQHLGDQARPVAFMVGPGRLEATTGSAGDRLPPPWTPVEGRPRTWSVDPRRLPSAVAGSALTDLVVVGLAGRGLAFLDLGQASGVVLVSGPEQGHRLCSAMVAQLLHQQVGLLRQGGGTPGRSVVWAGRDITGQRFQPVLEVLAVVAQESSADTRILVVSPRDELSAQVATQVRETLARLVEDRPDLLVLSTLPTPSAGWTLQITPEGRLTAADLGLDCWVTALPEALARSFTRDRNPARRRAPRPTETPEPTAEPVPSQAGSTVFPAAGPAIDRVDTVAQLPLVEPVPPVATGPTSPATLGEPGIPRAAPSARLTESVHAGTVRAAPPTGDRVPAPGPRPAPEIEAVSGPEADAEPDVEPEADAEPETDVEPDAEMAALRIALLPTGPDPLPEPVLRAALAGLARLPTRFGTATWRPARPELLAGLAVGERFVLPDLVLATAGTEDDGSGPGGSEVTVWSLTGRRVDEVLGGAHRDGVAFAPGTTFTVVRSETAAAGDPVRMSMREVRLLATDTAENKGD